MRRSEAREAASTYLCVPVVGSDVVGLLAKLKCQHLMHVGVESKQMV